jgi:hypothetical protein
MVHSYTDNTVLLYQQDLTVVRFNLCQYVQHVVNVATSNRAVDQHDGVLAELAVASTRVLLYSSSCDTMIPIVSCDLSTAKITACESPQNKLSPSPEGWATTTTITQVHVGDEIENWSVRLEETGSMTSECTWSMGPTSILGRTDRHDCHEYWPNWYW